MTEATIPMQTTTIACGGCGAALAADQRYCLHCGAAQADPRVAYRQLIPPAASGAPAPPAVPAPPASAIATLPPRDWTPLIALGTLAALALVLVVGVLIGKSGWDAAPASSPVPQVITVGGTAPAAAADSGNADDASRGGSGRGAGKKGATADRALQQKAQRDKQVLQDLESTSGADYQRKSARLPDTVALPGEPPPRDDKAPGGGSGAETIG